MGFIKGDINSDFAECNPLIMTFPAFSDIYDEYGKEKGSKICWSIFMLEDPDEDLNPYYRMNKTERLSSIKEYYYDEFDEDSFKDAIKGYSKIALSKEERLYKVQMDKLEELTDYMAELSPTEEHELKIYLEINGRLSSIWKMMGDLRTRMDKAKSTSTNIYGDGNLSKSQERDNKIKGY